MDNKNKVKTKVSKWGNGYGVRIPISIVEELSLRNGSPVALLLDGNQIIVTKESVKTDILKKNSIKTIYKYFSNKKNKNRTDADTLFGTKKGKEIW